VFVWLKLYGVYLCCIADSVRISSSPDIHCVLVCWCIGVCVCVCDRPIIITGHSLCVSLLMYWCVCDRSTIITGHSLCVSLLMYWCVCVIDTPSPVFWKWQCSHTSWINRSLNDWTGCSQTGWLYWPFTHYLDWSCV